eukprot:TRINITY_DN1013_c0_g1_i5.p1 TRINITY_DN1013_c0_g1~~TRINITY_DN1013_c0_g1_i5.p1  ORF type:complete len:194 (+),score=25.88 TRINITY_DN1013_c0_g1_i5:488-1069(+)
MPEQHPPEPNPLPRVLRLATFTSGSFGDFMRVIENNCNAPFQKLVPSAGRSMTYQQIAQVGVGNSVYYKNNEMLNQNLTQIEQLISGTVSQLSMGQWVDVKDTEGDWLEAQVIDTRLREVKIHYNEWTNNWDEWLPLDSDRIAIFRSHTIQHPKAFFQSPFPVLLAREQMGECSIEELLERYCKFENILSGCE